MSDLPKENIYGHTKKLGFVIEEIRRYVSLCRKQITILDFGCGNGIAVSQFLIQQGVRYYGVDHHEPSLRYARERFQCEDATFLDHLPEGILFDVILYADVLEHFENPSAILKDHSRILKRNGVIVGSVPNGKGPFEVEKRIDKFFGISDGIRLAARLKRKLTGRGLLSKTIVPYNSESRHRQFFNRRSLVATLREAGFEIEVFRKGAFLGGPLSERILRTTWVRRTNSVVGDWLPFWAVSTWYFTARKITDMRQIGIQKV